MEATLTETNTTTSIAGITMSLSRFSKVNAEPITDFTDTLTLKDIRPAISAVLREKDGEAVYVVDVFLYVPAQELQAIDNKLIAGGLALKQNELQEILMFLSYTGAVNIEAEDGKMLTSRSFKVEYDAKESLEDGVDLYHIQFKYSLGTNVVSAEAIYISFVDFDPIAPRGTVTQPM